MNHRKTASKPTFEELDRELIARGAKKMKEDGIDLHNPDWTEDQKSIMEGIKKLYESAPPPDEKLEYIPDDQLVKMLKEMSRGKKKPNADEEHKKGIIGEDDRMDFFEFEKTLRPDKNLLIHQEKGTPGIREKPLSSDQIARMRELENMMKIKKNLDSVGLVCLKRDVTIENGVASLKLRPFKNIFFLCECERFSDQLCVERTACTGFLVKKDVIASAGHFLIGKKANELCVVFGFKMENESTTITSIPEENIYNGVEYLEISYNKDGLKPDFALLKLDRPVNGREIAKLSGGKICEDHPVYTIGHPSGLPLKFTAGAKFKGFKDEFIFSADLDIFMGNSGSPVFDRDSHQVIGIVVQSAGNDFRWVNNCMISVINPSPQKESEFSRCTRISTLSKFL